MEQQTTREAILQAAKDLFTSKGFANTGVREVCQGAGVTAPALYYHFGSKDGLFQAVVEETLNPMHTLNPGLHLGNSAQLNGASLRRFGSGLEAIYELAREILQRGIPAGEFREVNVNTTAACLVGTVDSFVRAQAYLGVEYNLQSPICSQTG